MECPDPRTLLSRSRVLDLTVVLMVVAMVGVSSESDAGGWTMESGVGEEILG